MAFALEVIQKSQHGRKITDRVGVICPHNGERLTFVGQEGVGRQSARHGGRKALMKALNHPSGPHVICISCNLLADECTEILRSSSGLHRLQPVAVCRRGSAMERFVAPTFVTAFSDAVLVEQEPSRETRRRLVERETIPNGLDCRDAEGGAALGDPASIRS